MATTITGRALHYVLKIGDRAKNSHFFREILGMKVLRHEEFKEGCDAQCNGVAEELNNVNKASSNVGHPGRQLTSTIKYLFQLSEKSSD